jgi:hypothetical protein
MSDTEWKIFPKIWHDNFLTPPYRVNRFSHYRYISIEQATQWMRNFCLRRIYAKNENNMFKTRENDFDEQYNVTLIIMIIFPGGRKILLACDERNETWNWQYVLCFKKLSATVILKMFHHSRWEKQIIKIERNENEERKRGGEFWERALKILVNYILSLSYLSFLEMLPTNN